MKFYPKIIVFIFLFPLISLAQEIQKAYPENGLDKFKLQFAKALTIPTDKITESNLVQLKLLISFLVDENGEINNTKIINDKYNLTSEIEKTLKSINNWIPAQKNGENISTYNSFSIVLNINLNEDDSSSLKTYNLTKQELEFFHKEFDKNMYYPSHFWDSYYHKKNNYAMGLNASVNDYSYEIKFEIDEEGNFTNIQTYIDEKPNLELNKFTIKALKKCKKWQPLVIKNQKVKSNFSLPIFVKIKR